MTLRESSSDFPSLQPINLPFGLGLVHPLTADEVLAFITSDISGPKIIGNLNLHGLYMREKLPIFRQFCDTASVVIIDGWPVLMLAMISVRRRISVKRRVGSTDWVFPLIRKDPELKVVSVGGSHQSAKQLSMIVQSQTKRLTWHAFDGYDHVYCSEGVPLPLKKALSQADLVLVGMGMPLQEEWILQNLDVAPRAAFANVGGCLDYIAGVQPLAPRWMGMVGLEWLYRLVRNPRRLAGRYLGEPVKLLFAIAIRLARETRPKR